MADQPVDDLDRLLRIVDGHVDVHPEDQLAPRDVLELVDERPIPVLRGDALAFEERERMRPGGADAHVSLARDLADVSTQSPELRCDVAGGVADRGRDLEHRLHQLRVDARLQLVPSDRGEHRVDVLDEVEGLAVEQHVLLLDAERVCVALAERVVEDASALGVAAPLAGDRGREDLAHGSNASASISTRQAGSRRAATTTKADAGLTSPKTSPWARPTASQSAASTR